MAFIDNWFFWSVLASLCMAIIAHFNHKRRLDPQLLNAWHSTFAALMLMAAVPFTVWPELIEQKGFYIMAVVNGLVMAFGMIFFFRLALRRSSRVTSMVIPVAAVAAYCIWWVIAPETYPPFLESPLRGCVSIVSIMIVCLALQKVRSNDASWDTFVMVLPIGMAFGVRDAFVKWTLSSEMQVYATAITFTMISVVVWALGAWFAAMPKPPGGRERAKFFEGSLLWGSFWCGFWTVGLLVAGMIALIRAPNPAYPGIAMALTPLWLYAYNYFRGVHDDVSPVAGALIMLGAVGLLLSNL